MLLTKILSHWDTEKGQLEIFRKLLEENYLVEYKKDIIKNPETKDELTWQYFFNKILGF